MNQNTAEYLTAVFEKDYETISRLLDGGQDVGATFKFGNTAMRNVSMDGDLEMLKFLISRGADVNQKINYVSPVDGRQEEGFTPVFYACDEKTLELLCEEGADINHICKAGYTAFIKCCDYSYAEIIPLIKMHIKCGANLDISAPLGRKGKLVNARDVVMSTKKTYESLYNKARSEALQERLSICDEILAVLSS